MQARSLLGQSVAIVAWSIALQNSAVGVQAERARRRERAFRCGAGGLSSQRF